MENIIKYSGTNNIMSDLMNMAMNVALYSMSYGHNSNPKHNNNKSNNNNDGVKRRETCDSIGSKPNNLLAYSHRYECDHGDLISQCNEVNDADLESPVVPIHDEKNYQQLHHQYLIINNIIDQNVHVDNNVDGTWFIDLNSDGNRIETPSGSDDDGKDKGKEKEKDLLAALEPDEIIKNARSLGVKKHEDQNENRLDPQDIDIII